MTNSSQSACDNESRDSKMEGVSKSKEFEDTDDLFSIDRAIGNEEAKEVTEETESRPDVNPTSPSRPHRLAKNSPTYEVEDYTKNAMIIFNQEHFDSSTRCNRRIGTDVDAKALMKTFEQLKFEIVPPKTTKDLQSIQLLDALRNFCAKDFTNYGCICLAILTHGSDFGWLMAKEKRYNELDVFKCFDAQKNSTLTGKPIVIIIQACRGKTPAQGFRLELHMKDPEDVPPAYCYLPAQADMLIFHSSWEGTASALDEHDGSWFIQTICKNIKKYSSVSDLEDIFRRVRMDVALTDIYFDDGRTIMIKQMPVVTTTLIRKLFLIRPSQASGAVVEDRSDESALLMPAGKFLKYYEYIMKCLRLYIEQNKEECLYESVLLKTAEEHCRGPQDKQLDVIKLVCRHVEENADKFHQYELVYFHYPKEDF